MIFTYSNLALLVGVAAVILSAIPSGRADVAFAGLVAAWASIYLFMRHSVRTIRLFAPPMAAVFLWFGLISVSGSLNTWAPRPEAVPAASSHPAHTEGIDLRGDVRLAGQEILVTNEADKPWSDVVLSFGGADGQTYASRLREVAPGRTSGVQLSRFVGADGHPAPAALVKPRVLRVEAKIDGRVGAFTSPLAPQG